MIGVGLAVVNNYVRPKTSFQRKLESEGSLSVDVRTVQPVWILAFARMTVDANYPLILRGLGSPIEEELAAMVPTQTRATRYS